MPQLTMAQAVLGAAAIGSMSVSKSNRAARREIDVAKAERDKERAEFDRRLKKYEKSEYVPLDLEALKTENVWEDIDLTKDVLPAADYAREQFQEQQATIMQGLRGVAGTSGISGLAQALSGQAKEQAKETGISIGQQLAQGRKLALQERVQKQQQERAVILADMEGARQFEVEKMSTLIGVAGQKTYAATQALSQSMSNLAQIRAAQMQMYGSLGSAVVGGLGYTKVGGWTFGQS